MTPAGGERSGGIIMAAAVLLAEPTAPEMDAPEEIPLPRLTLSLDTVLTAADIKRILKIVTSPCC